VASGRAGILFDVGYCLMDESPRLRHALAWLAGALAAVGYLKDSAALDLAYRQACRAPDPGEPSLLVQMLRSLGVPDETATGLRRAVPWDAVPLEPYPDTLAALEGLRAAGLRLGILANQPASARADLDRAGVTPLCDGVWLSAAAGLAKPDPAFFQLALDAWRLPPGRVAYVGDRPDNDVAPARRLGLLSVRIRRGPHAEQPARNAAEQATIEAADLAEVARRLVDWQTGLGGARARPGG
jgi:HAD superfamily hydrolase (TIGR01509 family)